MEKIKKALERAQQSRVSVKDSQVIKSSDVNSHFHTEVPPKITYSKTKTIGMSNVTLRENRVITGDSNDVITDHFKVLRTHVLQRLKTNNWNTLAVTSPSSGCGKTLTSINLAISLAREVNHTVLLVDLDLRRPRIHSYLFQEPQLGMSDYLKDSAELVDILINPGFERLVVLPGNNSIEHSSEVLSSPKMVRLVDEIKSRYSNRIIIFDMPPILMCDDVMVFSSFIDAVLMVVEEGVTKKEELRTACELANQNSVLLGTVLNKSMNIRDAYGYY
jgi:protein-tyrosine kinase